MKNFVLAEIEDFLSRNEFSLSHIESMLIYDSVVIDNGMNNLIFEEDPTMLMI